MLCGEYRSGEDADEDQATCIVSFSDWTALHVHVGETGRNKQGQLEPGRFAGMWHCIYGQLCQHSDALLYPR